MLTESNLEAWEGFAFRTALPFGKAHHDGRPTPTIALRSEFVAVSLNPALCLQSEVVCEYKIYQGLSLIADLDTLQAVE